MIHKLKVLLLCLILISLVGCKNNNSQAIINGGEGVGATKILGYEKNKSLNIVKRIPPKRKYLTVNGIKIEDFAFKKGELLATSEYEDVFRYIQINGLINKELQNRINNEIKVGMAAAINQLAANNGNKITYVYCKQEGNYNNVLSIVGNICYEENGSYNTYYKSFVYDLKGGQKLQLKDVFTKGTDYVGLLNQKVNEYLIKDNVDEIILSRPFESINENMEFTVSKEQLKLYFNEGANRAFADEYELSIPIKNLEDAHYIYDRYAESKTQLYENKCNFEMVTNDIDIVNKEKNEDTDKYVIHSEYVQLKNMSNKLLEQKINTSIIEELNQYFKDMSQIKDVKDKRYNYINFDVSGNVLNKISLVRNKSINDRYEFKVDCYDISTGKSVSLTEFLKNNDKYKNVVLDKTKAELMNRGLNPNIFSDYNMIEQNTYFIIGEYALELHSSYDSNLLKTNGIDYLFVRIPYEELDDDIEKLIS